MSVTNSPRAARRTLNCKGWHQEAALRCLMNNLDPDVAERPDDLVVYGGAGKAARNWASFRCHRARVASSLKTTKRCWSNQASRSAVFRTHEYAPRVLIANSNLVGAWANWEHFHELERQGLMMYGQMTAGSWIYIGTQGIVQGTFETFAAMADRHFGGDLSGKLVVSGGMGGMGGAQPLAATLNGAVFLGIDVDPARIERRVRTGYCDRMAMTLDEALEICEDAREQKRAISVGLVGNCAEVLPELVRRGIKVDAVTDQTSAHDPLNGYVPAGLTLDEAADLRRESIRRNMLSVRCSRWPLMSKRCWRLKRAGAVAFDYGNNIRKQAFDAGCEDAFEIPGFVPEYIRPLFCEGKGPFRWVALSGDPADIRKTDDLALEMFPDDRTLNRWLRLARERVHFQGLPARICWLGYGERAEMGEAINDLVKRGDLEGADRDRPRSSGYRIGGVAVSRNRRDERWLGRSRRLAHP